MKTLFVILLAGTTTFAQTAPSQTTTIDETGPRKIPTLNRWHVGFGPGFTDNLDTAGPSFSWNVGYNFESYTTSIRMFLEGTGARSAMFGIGGNYYFSDTDISPVAQAWLGYGWTVLPGKSLFELPDATTGFALGTAAGFQFMRMSRVNLEVVAYYNRYLANNRLGAPSTYGLRVGVLF